MKMNKKGAITQNTVTSYIYIFIFVVVLLKVVAELLPEAQSAGTELNDTGKKFAYLFGDLKDKIAVLNGKAKDCIIYNPC
ncbi:MAG: hypothetical protein ACQERX_02140 [Bacillota bacterium]